MPPSTKRNIALAQVRRPCQAKGKLMVEVHALREFQYAKLMLRAQVRTRGRPAMTFEIAHKPIPDTWESDDVVITNFTTGPGNTTLPLLIWSKVKLGVTPDINALATITVLLVGIGVATAAFILNRAEKRRDRDARMAYRANE